MSDQDRDQGETRNQGPGSPPDRREFLKQAATAAAVGSAAGGAGGGPLAAATPQSPQTSGRRSPVSFPRVFEGAGLRTLAFPLGGVGTGSISLGGRGQLQDWEIFNRSDKGAGPQYGFASIWARAGGAKPVARVLESRLQAPYEGRGHSGLGIVNAPGCRGSNGPSSPASFRSPPSSSKTIPCRWRCASRRSIRSSRSTRTTADCRLRSCATGCVIETPRRRRFRSPSTWKTRSEKPAGRTRFATTRQSAAC